MLLRELTSPKDTVEELDEGPTWARSGKKVVRKYRCAGGPRKNRIVSQCTIYLKFVMNRISRQDQLSL